MRRTGASISAVLVMALLTFAGGAAADNAAPLPVSPGDTARFAAVGTSCPTFSWGAVEGAKGYEVAVYDARGGQIAETRAVDSPLVPALRKRVPGLALSWTPSAEECLKFSESYVWFIRAVGESEAGEWSEGRMFRVAPAPHVEEIGAVLERALERYLGDRGVELAPDGTLAALISEELAAGEPQPGPVAVQEERIVSFMGELMTESEAAERDPVFSLEDWELDVVETDSGANDYAQLVLSVPANEPDWAWIVNASTGILVLNGPTVADSLSFDPTDGSGQMDSLSILNDFLLIPDDSPLPCNGSEDEGHLYWDDSLGQLCGCDGSSWTRVRDGGPC